MTHRQASSPFGSYERMLALRYMKTKRAHGGIALISTISIIAIMLAVAVLIVTLSIFNGFRAEYFKLVTNIDGHIYIQPYFQSKERIDQIVTRINQRKDVLKTALRTDNSALLLANNKVNGIRVTGIEQSELTTMKMFKDHMVEGSSEGFGEGFNGGNLVLIGQGIAEKFGLKPGSYIELVGTALSSSPFGSTPKRKIYEIAGVFNANHSLYDNYYIFMPLLQSQVLFGSKDRLNAIQLWIKQPEKASEIKYDLLNEFDAVKIEDWMDRNLEFAQALKIEKLMMTIILGMIVVIASMNIISGLVMLIKNKSQDIAILRTIGVSRRSILRVFLMIGSGFGVLGTLLGLGLGLLISYYIVPIQDFISWSMGLEISKEIYFMSQLKAKINWIEVIWVLLWGGLTAVIITFPAALRASRLDPIEVLRYE